MATVAEGLFSGALELPGALERQRDGGVSDRDPKSNAAEQPEQRAKPHFVARVVRGGRIQELTVLSVIAATQVLWLAVLGYGIFWLFA